VGGRRIILLSVATMVKFYTHKRTSSTLEAPVQAWIMLEKKIIINISPFGCKKYCEVIFN
jgi:hypothetical protein